MRLSENRKGALIVWSAFSIGSILAWFIFHPDVSVPVGVFFGGVVWGLLWWLGFVNVESGKASANNHAPRS